MAGTERIQQGTFSGYTRCYLHLGVDVENSRVWSVVVYASVISLLFMVIRRGGFDNCTHLLRSSYPYSYSHFNRYSIYEAVLHVTKNMFLVEVGDWFDREPWELHQPEDEACHLERGLCKSCDRR